MSWTKSHDFDKVTDCSVKQPFIHTLKIISCSGIRLLFFIFFFFSFFFPLSLLSAEQSWIFCPHRLIFFFSVWKGFDCLQAWVELLFEIHSLSFFLGFYSSFLIRWDIPRNQMEDPERLKQSLYYSGQTRANGPFISNAGDDSDDICSNDMWPVYTQQNVLLNLRRYQYKGNILVSLCMPLLHSHRMLRQPSFFITKGKREEVSSFIM